MGVSRVGGRVTESQLFEAMCQNFGVLACAALSVGLTLASLVQRVARSKRLRAWRDGARSVLIRHAGERLQGAVAAGEAWALQFQARAGVKAAVAAVTGKPVEMLSFSAPRVAQPVAQGVPRLDLAEAMSRRLVVALDRGEPWAVMYCLSHLDPEGPFFAKCRRGRQHDLWAEQLAAAALVTESAAEVGDINGLLRAVAVDGAVNMPEENGDAEPRLMVDADAGLDGLVAAPPVGTRSVDFRPKPGCRLVMAVSAQADATKSACIAPPLCGNPFESGLRLAAGESGVGCSNFKIDGLMDGLDRLNIAPILKFECPTPVVAAPPVGARGVAFRPRPNCRQLMAASAEAVATRTTCLAPPLSGGQLERRPCLPAGGSEVGRFGERRLSARRWSELRCEDLRHLLRKRSRWPHQRSRAPVSARGVHKEFGRQTRPRH